ncbi:hypothetical protein [Pontibacter sp. G13]|uniref:hypothetical protein n=1 Tax=Pontibacter sp. G13 TaxID=3074898 RepID=UPI00288B07ED|nr:hypothetical protein [Pontibacter sp. G13]WNJ17219.1 hypothetical protein RJD25_20375 [Pontibacter sp. G13]
MRFSKMFYLMIVLSSLMAMIYAQKPVVGQNGVQSNSDLFTPDISINGAIFLENESSGNDFLKGLEFEFNDSLWYFPGLFFESSDGTQMLGMYLYPGGMKNAFSVFEVGYCKNYPANTGKRIRANKFQTENGVQLGMTVERLHLEKGKPDSVLVDYWGDTLYRYEYLDEEFLQHYLMPSYFLEYKEEDGQVSFFRFGFDYP